MHLRHQVARAVRWSAVEQWGTQLIALSAYTVLARLLEPKAFGLIAMAGVFSGFVMLFINEGFGAAIVQRAEVTREHLDTAFWTALLSGGVLMLVGIAASTPVAAFFGEPQLATIIRWLSLGFVLAALTSTQKAILRRDFAFKKLAARSLTAAGAGGAVGVTMAALGFGVWSLVAQELAGNLLGTALLWRVSTWRPGFRFSRRHHRELFDFGIKVLGARVSIFFARRSDDLLIGSVLGATALGYYTVAYRLVRLTTQVLTNVGTTVALPTFARLQQDTERLRQIFYTATRYAGVLCFPTFVGMMVLTPELVAALFGPDWGPSVPVMRVLALFGLVQCLLHFNGPVLLAMGKPSWHLALTALQGAASIAAFAIAVRWGIVAVAVACVAVTYLVFPVGLWALHRLIHVEPIAYLRQCAAPATASLAMLLAVGGMKHLLGDAVDGHTLLAAGIAVGAAVYSLSLLAIAPELFHGARDLMRLASRPLTWTRGPSQDLRLPPVSTSQSGLGSAGRITPPSFLHNETAGKD